MSRLKSMMLTGREYAMGRTVALKGDYDSSEKILEFAVPSQSRPQERVYIVTVDAIDGSACCCCEWFQCEVNARRNRLTWGTPLEIVAAEYGRPMLPGILRDDDCLCFHLLRVKQWIKRHGLLNAFLDIENFWIAELEDRMANKRYHRIRESA